MNLGPPLDNGSLDGVPLQRQLSKVTHPVGVPPLPIADLSSISLCLGGPSPPSSSPTMRPPLLTRQVSKLEKPSAAAAALAAVSLSHTNNNNNAAAGPSATAPVNVLMIGTGEYTTGYVNGAASDSDKGAGVVALTMLDLKQQGITGRLGLVGVNGNKFPGIRSHMTSGLGKYAGMAELVPTLETWPADDTVDPEAYNTALATYSAGDVAIIFTPDDTHFTIAMACIRRGMHVLVTKPAVKTLMEHARLHEEAKRYVSQVTSHMSSVKCDQSRVCVCPSPPSLLHAPLAVPLTLTPTFYHSTPTGTAYW